MTLTTHFLLILFSDNSVRPSTVISQDILARWLAGSERSLKADGVLPGWLPQAGVFFVKLVRGNLVKRVRIEANEPAASGLIRLRCHVDIKSQPGRWGRSRWRWLPVSRPPPAPPESRGSQGSSFCLSRLWFVIGRMLVSFMRQLRDCGTKTKMSKMTLTM